LQLATGGIERVAYKKLIAPFLDDLPSTNSEGLRRVCDEHKYAFLGYEESDINFVLRVPCHLVPLPDTFYIDRVAFITPKISPYKWLIDWR
jgi:hypothetical protein